MDIVKEFDSFILRLSATDRIAVIFHTDADGISAGVIAAKALERITGKKPALLLYPEASDVTLSKKIISELKKKKINKVIILDLNVDQEPRGIKDVEKFAEILILDHHSIQNDVNSERTIMIKPQIFSKIDPAKSSRFTDASLEAFEDSLSSKSSHLAPRSLEAFTGYIDPAKYCGAKLSFDFFSRPVYLDDLKWIAVVGIYGDMAESEWQQFIENSLQENNVTFEQIKEASGLIVYARSADEKNGPMKAFRAFFDAKTVKDVLKSSLKMYKERIEKELKHYIEAREVLAEFYQKKRIMIYEISPRYNIKSELVNRLSREYYPDWTCIVIQKKGKTASIGARNQTGKVAMNDLLIRATRGIKGASGGGHIQAAGGNVPNKKSLVEKVKERILESF